MTERLPDVLADIAAVIGEPSAVLFAAQAGGTRVYIPASVSDRHWLVACIGRRASDLLCRHFAIDGRGTRIDVPLAGGGAYPQLRRAIARRIHQLDHDHKSSREIAQAAGVTQRTVHRHRATHRGRKNDKQGSLF